MRIKLMLLLLFLLVISCSKKYELKNTHNKSTYYKISQFDKNHMKIECFLNEKLYFDYDLIRAGDSFIFSIDDKLKNERGKVFLSKKNNTRLYSYIIDLDGNSLYDSLITKSFVKEAYMTLIKDVRKEYSSRYRIFYYDKNFKIDSIYESSDMGIEIYK